MVSVHVCCGLQLAEKDTISFVLFLCTNRFCYKGHDIPEIGQLSVGELWTSFSDEMQSGQNIHYIVIIYYCTAEVEQKTC